MAWHIGRRKSKHLNSYSHQNKSTRCREFRTAGLVYFCIVNKSNPGVISISSKHVYGCSALNRILMFCFQTNPGVAPEVRSTRSATVYFGMAGPAPVQERIMKRLVSHMCSSKMANHVATCRIRQVTP